PHSVNTTRRERDHADRVRVDKAHPKCRGIPGVGDYSAATGRSATEASLRKRIIVKMPQGRNERRSISFRSWQTMTRDTSKTECQPTRSAKGAIWRSTQPLTPSSWLK